MSDPTRQKPLGLVGRLAGVVIAAALLTTVLALARPAEVGRLLLATDGHLLLAAAAVSAAFLVARGLRLRLLVGGDELRWRRATVVAAAAQAAALFAPARTGELALPWLLARVTGRGFTSGVSTLLAARTLDLATLGLWCGAAVLAVRGLTEPWALVVSVLLLAPSALLPLTLTAADRLALRLLARRGLRGRRWVRRVRRVRRGVEELLRHPIRLLSVMAVSLIMWGLQWSVAWILLMAMGHRWPPVMVVSGAAAAAAANVLPFNLVGNLGTLEAGWTAAFTALGIPLQIAAATGLAAHLWGLVFAAFFGAIAWVVTLRYG